VVCLSLCGSVMTVSHSKAAKLIAMPSGMNLSFRCVRWVSIHAFDCKMGLDQEIPKHTCESIYSKQVSRGHHRYGADVDWSVLDEGAHWRHLANTSELSVCLGDVKLL